MLCAGSVKIRFCAGFPGALEKLQLPMAAPSKFICEAVLSLRNSKAVEPPQDKLKRSMDNPGLSKEISILFIFGRMLPTFPQGRFLASINMHGNAPLNMAAVAMKVPLLGSFGISEKFPVIDRSQT